MGESGAINICASTMAAAKERDSQPVELPEKILR
jgi:hypothetical protein